MKDNGPFVMIFYLHLGIINPHFILEKAFLSRIMEHVCIQIYSDFILCIHKDFWPVSVFHRFTNRYASSTLIFSIKRVSLKHVCSLCCGFSLFFYGVPRKKYLCKILIFFFVLNHILKMGYIFGISKFNNI